jgi:1-deoxy-D-xylulose-5-phosphate reductoisomerase
MQKRKRLAILGSTGSIGLQTLEVARHLGLEVGSLAVSSRIDLVLPQIHEFNPKIVAVFDQKKALELKSLVPHVRVVWGKEGLEEAASCSDVDLVVSAITGFAGINPTIAAIKSGKTVALANKEVLVAAGEFVMNLARQNHVEIIPVDSEHSALFQCLEGRKKEDVRRLILTASGGPFFHYSQEELSQVSLEKALAHPSWKMGPKVTIDSSTLMNKGLEVIEAFHLFQVPLEQIDVIVHPQSVIHSMVEMNDGSCLAQMSAPSMIIPIQYAITYPERKEGLLPPFSFAKYPKLEFFELEKGKFRCLELAYEALREGGSFPCYLNAANEVLVSRFLAGSIRWTDIGIKLERLLSKHQKEKKTDLEVIFAVDAAARQEALTI